MSNVNTFSLWESTIHDMSEQRKRIASAKSAKTTPNSIDKQNKTGTFPGSGAVPYETTLETCTCVDFSRRKLPCKHIYRLAIELGLLDETAESGINKNTLISSQMTLKDAVAEVENFSDDCQLFIKNFPQEEPVVFSAAENDPELLSCSLLSTSPLEPQKILEQMQKKEIMSMLKKAGYVPEKNMIKAELIPWCIDNVPDLKTFLPDIVQISISPYAHKNWRKLYKYLRRKYDWESFYLESETYGMQEVSVPAESEYADKNQQVLVYSFPEDEITELLTLYGYNRCLNGYIVNLHDIVMRGQRKLQGERFAATGVFATMTRTELSRIIMDYGGRINEWVTKNTDYLVVGSSAGSKLQRAKEKGVPLLSEEEFLSLIKSAT